MRSVPAEPTRRVARPVRAGGFLLVPSLVLTLVALVAGCDREVDITPPQASPDSAGERTDLAQETLDGLVQALRRGSRSDATSLAARPAGTPLGAVHDNAADLQITGLSMRYVDEGAALSDREQQRFGNDAWRGTVQLAYRYDGFDESVARVETGVVFVPATDGVRIASFGGGDTRTPLWLAGPVSVVRTPESLLVVAAAEPGRYRSLVPNALRQVRRTLPDWGGGIVVEVPRDRAGLEAAVQSHPGQYDNIAAVTTTADGSLSTDAPVRVFVNPTVFGKLKTRGALVVMSHETTHVATGATFASMPTWLLEGFADFVALRDAGVPVALAARQILSQIRKDGLPRGLPTSEDLDPTAIGLGATYEEAWLACRFLGEEYGAERLVRFYRTVSGGARTSEAFRSVLGTTQREFVSRWRADLARLSGVAG